MARLIVSDISGEIIEEGRGATIRIDFHDGRRQPVELDVTDREVDRILSGSVAPKQTRLEKVREKHPRAYERWTSDEERSLEERFREGVSVSELARLHERQRGAIKARLIRLGLLEPE
jgi:hypothetical protein